MRVICGSWGSLHERCGKLAYAARTEQVSELAADVGDELFCQELGISAI
jgi:hypothetical protein